MRSRGSIFPRALCRSRAFSPPPSAMSAALARKSATRASIADLFLAKPPASGLTAVLRTFIASMPLKKLAPNQHASYLARARADLIEFCVAQQPARRKLVDIAIAPKNLNRVKRRLGCVLCRKEQSARSVFA